MERKNVRPLSERTTAPYDPTNKTQQAMAEACDVNMIMKQYRKTGVMTHQNANTPSYGDFSTAADYMTARNQMIAAEAGFAALSPDIRRRFDGDPEEMLRFLDNPDNLEEAVKLGMLPDPNPKPPTRGLDPSKPADPPPEPEIPETTIPEGATPIAGGD